MLGNDFEHSTYIDDIAASALMSLQNEHKLTNLDAIAEYSMGGRVAMAMMKCTMLYCGYKPARNCYYLVLTPGAFILMGRGEMQSQMISY